MRFSAGKKKMKFKPGRMKKPLLVFLVLLTLAAAYGVLNAPHKGRRIVRENGGSKNYHVVWGEEEFDVTISYQGKGDKKKSFLEKQKKKTSKELLLDYIREIEKKTRKKAYLELPDTYLGKAIRWEKRQDYTPFFLIVLGVILSVLMYKEPDWEKEKEEKKRKEKLVAQYPELVGILTTFLESGMSLRYAVIRMAEEGLSGEGPLQTEIVRFANRLKRGESLMIALQGFAKGCGTRQYRKFTSLLLQNLERGNEGLRQMLEMEVQESEALRLNLSKRKGEEAQTKILLSLALLLGLVIVILMAPAFLQIKSM